MKTIGERIRQARNGLKMSAHDLAIKVGYKHQSGIANLENRAGGSGGNKIGAIAKELNVPVDWLLNGPDSDAVPYFTSAQNNAIDLPARSIQELTTNHYKLDQSRGVYDEWTIEAIKLMQTLDAGQRQAMVAKMREYKQFLGPPRDGQALQVAGG